MKFRWNFVDLIPQENVDAWLKYLRNEYPAIAFKCSTQEQKNNLSQRRSDIARNPGFNGMELLERAECLGADTLLQLLKVNFRGKFSEISDQSSKNDIRDLIYQNTIV